MSLRLKQFWIAGLALVLTIVGPVLAQSGRTILLDDLGNRLTDNEFVDLRLANRSEKDPAVKTILADGTVQFKVARVPQEGMPAPTFEAPTIDGKMITSSDLKGKVVVLNFWFIGCPGCQEELPKLNALAAKYRGNEKIRFIAISPDPRDALRSFLIKEHFDYEIIGSAASLTNLFKFTGYPRNIVIGKDGRLAYWRTTVRAWDKFDSVIRDELAKK